MCSISERLANLLHNRGVQAKTYVVYCGVLSDDTTTRFREALREHCASSGGAHDRVHGLVRTAADEARDRGISAAQFVIWLKQVWEEIISEGVLPRTADAARIRELIVSSAIKAYYVQ